MKRFSFSNLRPRLILLIFVAIFPAFALTIYSGMEQRRTAIHQAETGALALVKGISNLQDRQIENARQIL
jgi:hypothetical protein